ncbi:hypothetical protein BGZ61DRAFT_463951 [Ilyonectria robusta]|uniref:uncharacterized protein n=1 Tax=Ilyonectria robusta TaxID=1079257 RepID=UPI001E8DA372|nr:uncharacterized protein BGZ61DRAFT_463951 [Ilyonectria robusta]KAH8661292.1 hypothetical protein BGZ61DRAFT_463951 [Ilyonectria robusta]
MCASCILTYRMRMYVVCWSAGLLHVILLPPSQQLHAFDQQDWNVQDQGATQPGYGCPQTVISDLGQVAPILYLIPRLTRFKFQSSS